MQLDVDFVRSQYPVFQQPELAEWAFFENAGGSYVPQSVIERLDRFFRCYKVQPYGPFQSSAIAGEAMDDGYRCMTELLNAQESEVTLGPSTTLNTYVLAQAIRPTLKPGDEIVVTNQDHEANIGCWQRLSKTGATIKWWKIDPGSGELNVADLQRLVSSRTRLVCFSLCSNIVGSFQEVGAISEIARSVGAMSVADGVSYAPHRTVDVSQLGTDVYLFSAYKTYGTHVGVMWIKEALFEQLVCQGHYFNRTEPHYRMNPTGPQHAEIAALAGIGEYYDTLYRHHFDETGLSRLERAQRLFELVAAHETQLANQLLGATRDSRRTHHRPDKCRSRPACPDDFVCLRSNALSSDCHATGSAQDRRSQRPFLCVAVPGGFGDSRSRGWSPPRQPGALQHACRSPPFDGRAV